MKNSFVMFAAQEKPEDKISQERCVYYYEYISWSLINDKFYGSLKGDRKILVQKTCPSVYLFII